MRKAWAMSPIRSLFTKAMAYPLARWKVPMTMASSRRKGTLESVKAAVYAGGSVTTAPRGEAKVSPKKEPLIRPIAVVETLRARTCLPHDA